MAEKQTFDRDELHDVSRRAFSLAKQTGDPSLRAALNLFGEEAPNTRSLQNFPVQANAAEMMRLAAIYATEAGVEVCAPVHDAFLIAAPIDDIDHAVSVMQAAMASSASA